MSQIKFDKTLNLKAEHSYHYIMKASQLKS